MRLWLISRRWVALFLAYLLSSVIGMLFPGKEFDVNGLVTQAPILESIKRWQRRQVSAPGQGSLLDQSAYFPSNTNTGNSQSETNVGDATFTTNPDASFASLKATPRRKSLAPPVTPATSTAPQRGLPGAARGGGAGRGRGRGGTAGGGARGSALPRGRGRGGK